MRPPRTTIPSLQDGYLTGLSVDTFNEGLVKREMWHLSGQSKQVQFDTSHELGMLHLRCQTEQSPV